MADRQIVGMKMILLPIDELGPDHLDPRDDHAGGRLRKREKLYGYGKTYLYACSRMSSTNDEWEWSDIDNTRANRLTM
jgi:hypothetical protein